MKKELSFNYQNNKYVLIDKSTKKQCFSIDQKKLQFDSKEYYESLFEDVNEQLEIIIINEFDYSDNSIDENIKKSSKHIYDMINSLTQEICNRLNEEYFCN